MLSAHALAVPLTIGVETPQNRQDSSEAGNRPLDRWRGRRLVLDSHGSFPLVVRLPHLVTLHFLLILTGGLPRW